MAGIILRKTGVAFLGILKVLLSALLVLLKLVCVGMRLLLLLLALVTTAILSFLGAMVGD
ncbi:MAG: hypothetical protein K2M60_01970 [Lachnospiraceae bacterium]|nr:hypothetical protein [Lachnospiraceae bacterium]MDE6254019.1 hypothetical protein [Lachnospiraceae bacterium]